MNRGQKVALKHAANAIDGTRPAGHVELGAARYISRYYTTYNGRPFASVYLAKRAGRTPTNQFNAQEFVANHYGLSNSQAAKVDRVAASTHNIKQRAQRVARFLRRVAENPTYVGIERKPTTGAVAASL